MTNQVTLQDQVEAVVIKARQQIADAKQTNDVATILAIRGKLMAPFMAILNLSSEVETYIKDLKLPKGTYGNTYSVRVSDENRRSANNEAIFKALEDLGFDPLDFAKADTTKAEVKSLMDDRPDDMVGSVTKIKKHSFKPF